MIKEHTNHKFAAGAPLIIITGLSGAGKSTAMRCFEDLGCYCVDNLPPALIPTFYGLYQKSYSTGPGVAIASDIRSGILFDDFKDMRKTLERNRVSYKVLYLDCDTDTLINRYKEVKRVHPLQVSGKSMAEAIEDEKRRLEPIREFATRIIDTSDLRTAALREAIIRSFAGNDATDVVKIEFVSFGFKYGIPLDADFIFDMRFLTNPFYDPELAPLTGEDEAVYKYVMASDGAEVYFESIVNLLEPTLNRFMTVAKFNLTIGVGCTGGRHRSVAFTKRLAEHFKQLGHTASAVHRDIAKPIG